MGLITEADTKHVGIAGTLSGCGPAFAAMFIEALGDAGVLHGLPRGVLYFFIILSTASMTAERNPFFSRAATPVMVVPPGEQTASFIEPG